MVQEICVDITGLDHAKRHLQASITALRHLHMLVSATAQLREWVDSKDYTEAARLLDAIQSLLTVFEPYKHVDKIRLLERQITAMKSELQGLVLGDLNTALLSRSRDDFTEDRDMLRAACLVLDHLDHTVRHKFLQSFVNTHLEPYATIFRPGGEGFNIEQIPRRYSWARRELRRVTEVYAGIFPERWHVSRLIIEGLCTMTKSHVQELLSRSKHASITLDKPPALPNVHDAVLASAPVLDKSSGGPIIGKGASLKGLAHSISAWGDRLTRVRLISDKDKDKNNNTAATGAGNNADPEEQFSLDDFMGKEDSETSTQTEKDSSAQSSSNRPGDAPIETDVALFLSAFLRTVEYERELLVQFPVLAVAEEEADEETDDIEILRSKYANNGGTGKSGKNSGANASEKENSGKSKAVVEAKKPRTITSFFISPVFVPYVASIVLTERTTLSNALNRISSEETYTLDMEISARRKVHLSGADELLLHYKRSLTQCAKTQCDPLLIGLWKEYNYSLRSYVSVLAGQVKWRPGVALNADALTRLSLIINTAEYVLETLPVLMVSVEKKLLCRKWVYEERERENAEDGAVDKEAAETKAKKQSAEGEAVDDGRMMESPLELNDVTEAFEQLLHECTTAIVQSVVMRATAQLSELSSSIVIEGSTVSDMSPCIAVLLQNLGADVPILEATLSGKYHSMVTTQVAAQIVSKFKTEMYTCRGITSESAQQLAIDLHSMKDALLNLPLYSLSEDGKVVLRQQASKGASFRVFTRVVKRDVMRLETLLKVLAVSADTFVQRYVQLLNDGTEEELRKLCELKGWSRQAISSMVASFNSLKAGEKIE